MKLCNLHFINKQQQPNQVYIIVLCLYDRNTWVRDKTIYSQVMMRYHTRTKKLLTINKPQPHQTTNVILSGLGGPACLLIINIIIAVVHYTVTHRLFSLSTHIMYLASLWIYYKNPIKNLANFVCHFSKELAICNTTTSHVKHVTYRYVPDSESRCGYDFIVRCDVMIIWADDHHNNVEM